MGGLFAKAMKVQTPLEQMAKADPLFKKSAAPLLRADSNFRKNMAGTNTPKLIPPPSAPSATRPVLNESSPPAPGLAAKTVLG